MLLDYLSLIDSSLALALVLPEPSVCALVIGGLAVVVSVLRRREP